MIMRTKKALRNGYRREIIPWVMIFIVGFLLVIVFAASFSSNELKKEWFEGTDDDYYYASTTLKTGMTFNVTNNSFYVTGVALKIYRIGTPGASIVGIYNTNATGQPTTLISENTSFNADDLGTGTGGAWFNITLPSATLLNNTNYIILINHTTSGSINIRAQSGVVYIYGETTNYNSANAWSKPGSDSLFQVYGTSGITSTLTITLVSPSDLSILSSSNGTFVGNFTPVNLNLTNATIFIWNSTHAIINQTMNVVLGNVTNHTEWNITGLTIDSFKWNILGCGVNNTGTLCSWRTANYTFDVAAQVDIEKWTNFTYETKNETFYINITVPSGINLYSANLIYNGISYLATKKNFENDRYELSRKIDIPITSGSTEQNITFYWNIEYLNGLTANQNTTARNLTVKPLIFSICNGTYNPGTGAPLFVNYTIYNETDRINITSIMDASFSFYTGEGSVIKNYSLDTSASLGNYSFCSNQNGSIYLNPVLNLKSNFYERTYYFIKNIYNNVTTHQFLFMQDAGRNIIIQVKDSGLSPLKNYYVEIERYYPEINKYYIVEGAKTDIYGQFVARLIEPNTIKYRFTFKDSNGDIKKVTGDMTIACPYTTSCILPFVIEDTEEDFAKFTNATDYDWSLSYNNNTHKFTFTWNDISGKSIRNRLYVERMLWNGTTIVCNTTSTSKTGSLTCDVGSSSASYTAQAFRKVGSDIEKRIGTLSVKVGEEYKTFGKEGLLWSFILLLTLIAVGYHYPPAGIVLYLAGFLLLGAVHIIYISPFIMFGELVIGLVFIWAFKKGRSG